MYQINIQKGDEPIDVVQHNLCAEDITDVEMMLTAVVSKRLGIPNIVLMPIEKHSFLVFQVVNLYTEVSVVPLGSMG